MLCEDTDNFLDWLKLIYNYLKKVLMNLVKFQEGDVKDDIKQFGWS